MPFQRNPRRLKTAHPKGGFRVWGRTLLAVVALVVPTLTAIPASASGGVYLRIEGGGGSVEAVGATTCVADAIDEVQTCEYNTWPLSLTPKSVAAPTSGTVSGWKFSTWSGACTGTGTCAFASDAFAGGPYEVTAHFVPIYRLTITMIGSGRVSGVGMSCSTGGTDGSGTCWQTYTPNSPVALSASAEAGYSFSGWTVDREATTTTTSVTMDRNKQVTATFTCSTEYAADPIAEALRFRGSPIPFSDLDARSGLDYVRGCYLAVPPLGSPNGVRTATLAGFPSQLPADDSTGFGVLTTGSFDAADDPNTNGSVGGIGSSLGGPNVRGSSDLDVTVLRVDFNASAAACVTFDFQFFSEEVGDSPLLSYNDAFVAELDSTSWYTFQESETRPATVYSDDNIVWTNSGKPINVSVLQSNSSELTPGSATGTTYDGATTILQAQRTLVSKGGHALFLSIFDVGDRGLDSAVFLDALNLEVPRLVDGAPTCPTPVGGATPVKYPINVAISPVGGGEVVATSNIPSDAGFTCPSSCGQYYLQSQEAEVSLTASPSTHYRFDKWRGTSCSDSQSTTCSVTMDKVQTLTAKFIRQYALQVSTSGQGTVSAGPDTGKTLFDYDPDPSSAILKTVTLTAIPTEGNLVSWSGCSAATGLTCTAVMNRDRDVYATFYSTASEGLRTTVTAGPGAEVASGERVTYTVRVENKSLASSLTGPLTADIQVDGGDLPDVTLVAGACTGANGLFSCPLSTLAPNGSQTVSITVDAPTVGPLDRNLTATFTAGSAVSPGRIASVSTVLRAGAANDFQSGAGDAISTFDNAPVSDRNPTGTIVNTTGQTVTIGEADERASGAMSTTFSTTSAKTTTTTSTTAQPICDTKLVLTCWRFDLDAQPKLDSSQKPYCRMSGPTTPCYTFTFVWDRTTFTTSDGMLQISLRKIYIYHRADGKTSYVKLGACPSTGSISAPCVKSIALQAATGDLQIVVLSPLNGQWKGGR